MIRVNNSPTVSAPAHSLKTQPILSTKEAVRTLMASFDGRMRESQKTSFLFQTSKKIRPLPTEDSLEMFYQGNSQMAVCGWVIAVALLAAVAQIAEAMAGTAITARESLSLQTFDPAKMNVHQLMSERTRALV